MGEISFFFCGVRPFQKGLSWSLLESLVALVGQLRLRPAWFICPQLELDAFPDLLALVDVLGNDCRIRETSQKRGRGRQSCFFPWLYLKTNTINKHKGCIFFNVLCDCSQTHQISSASPEKEIQAQETEILDSLMGKALFLELFLFF